LPNLAQELPVVLAMMVATVVLHMSGLTALTNLTRLHIERWRTPWLSVDRLLAPLLMVVGLFGLHALEVAAYAVVYRQVGAVSGWEAALYLSAGAYSTAGWTGLVLAKSWRVLAAFESLNGILLLGWSTAFLFQTLHRILQTEETHPLQEGALAEEPLGETELVIDEPQADGAAVVGIESPRRRRSGKGAP
jgi:hypothetical protein